MIALDFLQEYIVPVIVGICLCVGFVIKSSMSNLIDSKFIPVINAVLGLAISMWINYTDITPTVVLSGLMSGLAATGLYEAFKNLLDDSDSE